MRNPIAVANKILEVARASGDGYVTPMQLIKLAYISHGWMLGMHGRPLLNESIEAWRYGPVVRSIYDSVKAYKDQPITKDLHTIWLNKPKENFDATEEDLIRQVYDIYGDFDGITLSKITHQPGSPWYVTWNENGKNAVISNDLIENHYKRKYAELSAEQQSV